MSIRHRRPLLLLLFLVLVAWFLFRYGESWSRRLLLYLSQAQWARDLVTGFPLAWRVAGRFVAGEGVEDALRATQELQAKGMAAAMDYLGESVSDPAEAAIARDHILEL